MLAEKEIIGDRSTLPVQPQVKKRRRRRREGEEEEPVLRTTCDNCTNAKVKCNGEKPCLRCKNKSIHCEYTFKKRCGPKRRKNVDGSNGDGDNDGLLASCGAGNVGFDEHLRGMSVVLGRDEVECVGVFMQNVNSFLPVTTFKAVKQAATETNGGGGSGSTDGSQDDEEENQLHHARKALLHGAIAVGAEFLEKEDVSVTHAGIARQEIKECFDAAVPELVGAYLILALYWTHQMDSSKIARYMGLAHQSNGIICDPPKELVSSLTFVSVVLYDSKVLSTIGCTVSPPGPPEKPGTGSFNTPAAYQERVLKLLSFVLLAIHNRALQHVNPATSTGEWQAGVLAGYVDEAKCLLDMVAAVAPNDMSRCVVIVLRAYFLLLNDDKRQAVAITEPIADLVGDNPLVLHLPIVWSIVGCARSLLEGANRTIAVERLQSAMEPIASRLGFSSEGSLIQQELMSVFHTKQRPARGGSAAGGAAPLSQDILLRQKAQTSSLNVTARDYSVRNRSPVEIMNVEPSAAPRRRALPASTSRPSQPSGGGGGRGDANSLSPSLLFAAQVSSVASVASVSSVASLSSVLASPPPPSRAGALARVQNARGSLSNPSPFESTATSMLQLDIPYSPERDFPDTAPGIVPIGRPADMVLPGIVPITRTVTSPVPEDEVRVKPEMVQGGTAAGDVLLEETKLEADRRELMGRQQIQQSFKADEPVSLEQVESNMAKLGMTPHEGDAALNRIVRLMHLDEPPELLAANKPAFS